jgi:ArsR family transcriptional regulator
MRNFTKAVKSLSDETRLRIINLLLERACCVCEVMQALRISQTRASRNLNILYEAGFLKLERDGLWAIYSLDKEGMPDYLYDMIKAASKALKKNEVFAEDKKRLGMAVRVGPKQAASL